MNMQEVKRVICVCVCVCVWCVCVCVCRDLVPGVAVWRQSGDPPLQQSGSRLQEETPIRLP